MPWSVRPAEDSPHPREQLVVDERLAVRVFVGVATVLFGPILGLRGASWCARWSRRPRLRDTIRRRSRPGAGPADWHLFTIDVEGAAFHDYDSQEDVHHVKKWTPARGYEASMRSITT